MKKYRVTKAPSRIYKSIKLRPQSASGSRKPGADNAMEASSEAFEDIKISSDLDYNLSFLKGAFGGCYDFIFRTFTPELYSQKCLIAFLGGMINQDIINRDVIKPLQTLSNPGQKSEKAWTGDISRLMENTLLNISVTEEVFLMKDAVKLIMDACCVLFIDGSNSAIVIYASDIKTRSVGEAQGESVLRGPLEAFIEDVNVNVTMIRRRLKTTGLKMEQYEIGKQSKTKVILAYLEGTADGQIIEEARKRLQKVDLDVLFDGGQIQGYIEDDPLSPFPQMDTTERPDVCTAALAEGRFAILVDGSPFVIMAPTTLMYMFGAAEDYYNKFYFVSFIRIVCYLAFFITLGGPSLYIAVTTYHPEMLPATLLISVLSARANVPFPALVEAILMELVFELVREVAIRLPNRISQALSIVGALVIGQISVQAGLVSPLMIITVSVTGLASFVIPKINSARQVSVLRFPLMLFAATMGIFGLIMAGLVILIHLAALRSFGVPYLSPFTPLHPEGIRDTVIILPPWAMKRKPTYIISDAGEVSSNAMQYRNRKSKAQSGK